MKKSNIISIHCGHNASVALMQDGKITFAISEERFNRIKNSTGFPELSLQYIKSKFTSDIDKISTNSIFYENAYRELTAKSCDIKNDVWIGVDSIIRRGVKIGNGAVIGANSFVNNDIPDYAIVVGSPAKIIKYRFTKKQIDIINNSKWWEFDINEAKKIISQLEIEIKKITS